MYGEDSSGAGSGSGIGVAIPLDYSNINTRKNDKYKSQQTSHV